MALFYMSTNGKNVFHLNDVSALLLTTVYLTGLIASVVCLRVVFWGPFCFLLKLMIYRIV